MITVRQTMLFGPCEKKSKKVVRKESTAITSSDAARDNEDTISIISSYDSVSVELESNNSHSSSEIESSTPYSGDFQPPADSAMSAERFDCVALCCANMDKPFQPKDKNTLQKLASKRNFQPQWYKKFPWLSVCLTRKKVFCLYCRYCTRQNLITFSKMGENVFTKGPSTLAL